MGFIRISEPSSPDVWDESKADFSRVVAVAGQFFMQSPVFQICPAKQGDHNENRRDETPIGAEQQGCCQREYQSSEISRMPYESIGSIFANSLIPVRLNPYDG